MPMKTLFLNPPSFETLMAEPVRAGRRRARSSPTGIRFGCAIRPACWRAAALLDAPPAPSRAAETIEIASDYDFVVLFTSTPGL